MVLLITNLLLIGLVLVSNICGEELPSIEVTTKSNVRVHRLGYFLPCLNVCPRVPIGNFASNCTKLSIGFCLAANEEEQTSLFSTPDVWLYEEKSEIYLNWTNSLCTTCIDSIYSPAYRIEVRNGSKNALMDKWFSVGMTCDNQFSFEWPSTPMVCEDLQFRVRALGQCLEELGSYSEIANMSGLRLPPSLSDLYMFGDMEQLPGDVFKINILWHLQWSKWSSQIKGYSLTLIAPEDCPNQINRHPYPTKIKLPPFYSKDKTIAITSLDVHHSSIGCRLVYRLTASSSCNTTSSVTFKLDLVDCHLVPDALKHRCIVPAVNASTIRVGYARVIQDKTSPSESNEPSKSARIFGRNLFCVNWMASTTLIDRVQYRVGWQTSYINMTAVDTKNYHSLAHAMVYEYLGNKTVPGNSTCAIIDCDLCLTERLYFQVVAVDVAAGATDFSWGQPHEWPCFDGSLNSARSSATLDEKELAAICPCYHEKIGDANDPPPVSFTSPAILSKCPTRIWEDVPDPIGDGKSTADSFTTTTTSTPITTTSIESSDYTTSVEEFLDLTTTKFIQLTSTLFQEEEGTSPAGNTGSGGGSNVGIDVWLPLVLAVATTLAIALGLITFHVYRSRPRTPPLTVDNLREVMTEVTKKTFSSGNILRQTSGLSTSTVSTSNDSGRSTGIPLTPTSSISSSNERWEIALDLLSFTEQLGKGAFGTVMKATIATNNLPTNYHDLTNESSLVVAVKMVPDNADEGLVVDFLNEIDVMKRMGRHPCLVNMIACITQSRPICLVVEYADKGDLLAYLHAQKTNLQQDGVTLRDLNYMDLITFARQIALGMEFISVRGFIHRDLACRNVMVDQNRNGKIGDFGLARFGCDNSVYFTRIGRAIPIRWMPPEAIHERQFSSAGDVWSYGILLYELVTLGCSPYPGMGLRDVVRGLRDGYHMEKPATRNCPDSLYQVMLKCWSHRPDSRPSFTVLVKDFTKLHAEWTSSDYVDFSLAALTVYDPDEQQESDDDPSFDDSSLPNFM